MAPTLLIFPLLLVSAMAQADFKPKCNTLFERIRHPEDCGVYYQCSWGKATEIKCQEGLVFSLSLQVCVWPKSENDDCAALPDNGFGDNAVEGTTNAPLTIEERCEKDPKAVFPNPTECHQFYNCSRNWTDYRYFPRYKDECPYPQLFNADTLQCENYTEVQCGQRTERKYACDYDHNKCPGSHCIPCNVRFPDCTGQPDGRTVFESKKWSPWYGICKDERSVGDGLCERDSDLNIAQFFSPDANKCVSLYEIPHDKGGYFLNCTGLPDGFHPDNVTNRPNVYYYCENGERKLVGICPGGYVYGDLVNACFQAFVPIPPV